MPINVKRSIQEYLKKINSRLTFFDCVSILVTTVFFAIFVFYMYVHNIIERPTMSYYSDIKSEVSSGITNTENSRPFASINGKTYTFSWCQNATLISEKNKIYFNSEEEAKNSGRVLSKFCQK